MTTTPECRIRGLNARFDQGALPLGAPVTGAAGGGPGIFELLKPETAPADPRDIDQIAGTLHELLRR